MVTVRYLLNTETNAVFEFPNATWMLGLFDTDEGREAIEDVEWFFELARDEDTGELCWSEDSLRWIHSRIREFVGDQAPSSFKVVSEYDWELDYPDHAEEYPSGLRGLTDSSPHWKNGELALGIPFHRTGSIYESDYEVVDGKWVFVGEECEP